MDSTDRPSPHDDDTEGHRLYSSSDRNIKHDVIPVEDGDSDDTEGHRAYSTSDRNIKHDVTPVEDEDLPDL